MFIKGRFTRIKDISERRRLPRLGKIKLGLKIISSKTGREYPRETEYFIVPPEVAKVYGERPTSLEVMFPINDPEVVFPQAYKWYGGQRGLKCIGDQEVALRFREETQSMEEIPCPCERKDIECQKRGHLMVILPRVNMGGVYQIDVGSYHSIVDVNSGIEYVQALVGRFAMVPLRLCRMPKETHFDGQKQIHYTLQLFLDADVDLINALRQDTSRVLLSTRALSLPPPEDTVDENGVITEEEEERVEQKEEGGDGIGISPIPSSSFEAKGPKGFQEPSRIITENEEPRATKQQIEAIRRLAEKKGVRTNFSFLNEISYRTASKIISGMQKRDFRPEEFENMVDREHF